MLNEELAYDLVGNITSLKRGAATATLYDYTTGGAGNQLRSVSGGLAGSFTYDVNGSMLTDGTRAATLTYNHLNLPATVTRSGGNASYLYDASGSKLRSVQGSDTREYISGIQYTNNALDFVATEEGRTVRNPSTGVYKYEYNLKDHLGNVRVTFDKFNDTARVIQEDEFYAFGLNAPKYFLGDKNRYLYNGKELQDVLSNEYDYGARFYDPVIGRWNVVDPLAEEFYSVSGYNYTDNNPIANIDPDGRYVLYGAAAQQWFAQEQRKPYQKPQKTQEELARERQEAYESWMNDLRSFNKLVIDFMNFKIFAEDVSPLLVSKLKPRKLPVDPKKLLSQVSVERELENYVLNLDYPIGGEKAKWFERALGFTKSNMEHLVKQIVFDPRKAVKTNVSQYGVQFNQTITITGANGRVANITTGWIKGPDNIYKLVTAFPKK